MIIDGSGNEITTHDYALESELLNLSKIESTVENLRPQNNQRFINGRAEIFFKKEKELKTGARIT
jgi:hypothetical protein